MTLTIVKPGLLTTIQDLGRYGFQKFGVPVSGAMDPFALRIANLLVGNEEGQAALEITLQGPTLRVESDALLAVTGADLGATINGQPFPCWRPVLIKQGSVLAFGTARTGCRAYLAVAGGFDVPLVMASRSTYLRGRLGGLQGRALQAGDVLKADSPSAAALSLMDLLAAGPPGRLHAAAAWGVGAEILADYTQRRIFRVMPGSHYAHFTAESRQDFWRKAFRVTPQSDRMGYRLAGPVLRAAAPLELLSEAVACGTIQVPPDGNPIILTADRQTTGGYPRFGQIATADMPILAQVRPGEEIRFVEITLPEAERLYLDRERKIAELKYGILLKQRSRM
ncbi:biotin-dependent carboxyltransferase family protein [Brevibacillus sp. SYP-B805]|uniref:5-oxoprolinase subunit C family protein n=1 Tax=Brevibacillus sp. SYP-B805 TaxID=1578199 RepID=UPI0013ED9FD1|nr:biotin-dependent carboxyltransferase family protein [Brevibacillus sp. SYP-B805]NGQ93670.1 biotin-dependent carboxyltransferase family protein [Brevibacillus sp. SYP-B805]